jgi:PIN domain nuclease of toxin-antitoxin system
VPILLDTQVVLWWLADDERLGPRATTTLDVGPESVAVSVVSLWEAAIKHSVGKLDGYRKFQTGFGALPVAVHPVRLAHVAAVADLPLHHRDPFDRILVAQAQIEGCSLMTADAALAAYDVPLIDPRR